MPEEQVDNEQIGGDLDPGTLDTDLDTGDSGLDATTADEQVAQDAQGTRPAYDLSDVPEESRAVVEAQLQAKLKNLEAGYTQKYQTVAEEKRAFEAEKQAFLDSQRAAPASQAEPQPDPWQQHDWDLVEPEVRTVAEQTYNAQQRLAQLEQMVYGKVVPTIQGATAKEEKAALRTEYGEAYDDGALDALAKANPGIPLKFIAAEAFKERIREQGAQKAYQNVTTKRQANAPVPSAAKVSTAVDTKGWGLRQFYEHAKRTGQKLD
jgi:hypothetical protein